MVVAAFNQEKALEAALYVIRRLIVCSSNKNSKLFIYLVRVWCLGTGLYN